MDNPISQILKRHMSNAEAQSVWLQELGVLYGNRELATDESGELIILIGQWKADLVGHENRAFQKEY